MASGAGDGPVHAGQFEALADDCFAAGFDGAGADEQAAGAEPVVAHAGRVVLEVAQGRVQLVFLDAVEGVGAGGGADAVDVAVVEVLQAGGEPVVFAVAEHELQEAGEVVQVLAGVEQVHDLGGLGELGGGDVPDPGGAVAEDGQLADVARRRGGCLRPRPGRRTRARARRWRCSWRSRGRGPGIPCRRACPG